MKLTSRTLLLATGLATLVACATDPADGSHSGGLGGKADGDLVTITFDGGWNETADGPLVAGDSVRIDYDLDRLTDCRGSDMGSEVWGITGYAQFDDGEPRAFALSRLSGGTVVPVEAELPFPASARHVAMWFQVSNKWGCVAYDSNMNANYGFDIEGHDGSVVLAFDGDWSETQSGPIQAGDQMIVHYDPSRLDQCAGSTGGHAAWGITGYYQVDGGTVKSVFVSRADGPDLVPADPSVAVPHGHDLAMWFETSSVWGCHAYDSNMNANYHFTID